MLVLSKQACKKTCVTKTCVKCTCLHDNLAIYKTWVNTSKKTCINNDIIYIITRIIQYQI